MMFDEKITKMLEKTQSLTVKNDRIFTYDYIPDAILHRESECMSIGNAVLTKKHLIIVGIVSTGKTVCVRKMFELLKKTKPEWLYVYHNCKDTTRRDIYCTIISELGGSIGKGGVSISEYNNAIAGLTKNVERIVLCLDEVDDLCKRYDPKELFYDFANSSKYGLVFISNKRSWYDELDPKVSSRLQASTLNFSSYTEDEILNILTARLSNGVTKKIVSLSEIQIIANIANKQLDKLRVGIKALSNIIDWKALNDKESKELTHEEIQTFFEGIDEQTKYLFFENVPIDYKFLICLIAKLSTENETIDLNLLVKKWNDNLSNKYEITSKSKETIRLYLEKLETHGFIIKEKIPSASGKGRSRYVYKPLFDTKVYMTLYDMNQDERADEMDKLKKALLKQ